MGIGSMAKGRPVNRHPVYIQFTQSGQHRLPVVLPFAQSGQQERGCAWQLVKDLTGHPQ